MPVGRVARQPRYLEAHHDARVPQADIGDEALKPIPPRGGGARLALVAVDDDDLLLCPAQRDRALAERVLPRGALGILEDLPQRGLPDVEICGPLEMWGGDIFVIVS